MSYSSCFCKSSPTIFTQPNSTLLSMYFSTFFIFYDSGSPAGSHSDLYFFNLENFMKMYKFIKAKATPVSIKITHSIRNHKIPVKRFTCKYHPRIILLPNNTIQKHKHGRNNRNQLHSFSLTHFCLKLYFYKFLQGGNK